MTRTTSIAALALVLLLAGGAFASETDTRVSTAAMRSDLDAVRALIQSKADVNAAQGDGMTALHWAAFKDDAEMTSMLIAAGANVHAKTRIGEMTPLFLACTHGNAEIVGMLLKAGSDANVTNTVDGQTALMRAAASGSAAAVEALIAKGAKVNVRETGYGQTAAMFAAADNRGDVIRVLAKHGADFKATSSVEDLLSKPRYDDDGNLIPPPAKDPKTGNVPLASVGNRSVATAMGGMTALLLAARDGQMNAVKALVESGADVNQVSTSDYSSPLVISTANGHFDVARYLLDNGANPNAFNKDGLTPLYATIDIEYAPLSWAPVPLTNKETVGYMQMLEALLKAGANPNARLTRKLFYRPSSHDRSWTRPEGSTAFWRAALAADVPAMKLLVEWGADPKIASDEGVTPLMAAAGIGWVPGEFTQTSREPKAHLEAVQYCISQKLDINARDKFNQTALHGAAWLGDHELIQFLVDKGAKLDIKSTKGWYVTDMPNGVEVSNGLPIERPATVAFLMKLGAPAPVAPKSGDGVAKK